MDVLDVGGRLVRRLGGAGQGTTVWDGRDSGGREVPGGVYFLHAVTEGHTAAKRLVIVRRVGRLVGRGRRSRDRSLTAVLMNPLSRGPPIFHVSNASISPGRGIALIRDQHL